MRVAETGRGLGKEEAATKGRGAFNELEKEEKSRFRVPTAYSASPKKGSRLRG